MLDIAAHRSHACGRLQLLLQTINVVLRNTYATEYMKNNSRVSLEYVPHPQLPFSMLSGGIEVAPLSKWVSPKKCLE